MSDVIGIQGGKASYHELAVKQMHPSATIKYFETFKDVFTALKNSSIDSALVALANNRMQFISDTYELLTSNTEDFVIVGEKYLKVEHALLALQGGQLSSIREVYSQAPALLQCSNFIDNELPHASIIETHDTADSAEFVSKSRDTSKAAIASMQAAKLYGLDVIAKKIQNDKDNITRFIQLKRRGDDDVDVLKTADKTSMLLFTPQTAGSLISALLPFQESGINLSYLQSKVMPNSAFDMMFFVEFEAGMQEMRSRCTLDELHSLGHRTKILVS
ncbi:MAG: prephenate dehydratase domain-containing protein [Candidatus Saccharibacteria bacterium]|nr:prephenate dehydratase domain-containing protein [Candidatus Saccharibacteria bacterium]